MKRIAIILSLISCGFLNAQSLNVPARPGSALPGSQVISAITNLSLHDREEYILNEVLTGNIPDFQRTMILVNDSSLISGSYVHIAYYVIPDYLALGSNSDYYLCPMTPILAQRLADSLNCILPTRKMVDNIWSHATVKMNPESIAPSPQMTTVPVMSDHNDMVWTQRQTFFPAHPLGELVSGDKKDVVLSNLIYTNAPPARVVIYGWHYPSGSNIQPLYAGHIDTYADYSHGIRMVQKEVYVDGTPMNAETVLSSSTLNTLLSDEGALPQPYYPDTASGTVSQPIPNKPTSFCVLQKTSTAFEVKVLADNNVDGYEVYLSTDGINYSYYQQYNASNFTVSGLQSNTIYFVKLTAINSSGSSTFSEVLGAITTDSTSKYLIVNGFDRASTGNTYDFIRQHAAAIWNDTIAFSSATNDAVLDSLVSLMDYPALDYILGEESTVDETFDYFEQDMIEDYLDAGGYLFVSAAEIGWDLDYQGTAQDQTFYNNYMKAYYAGDAPGGVSNTYYNFSGIGNGLFDTLSTTSFDDGTHGTYNVDYPDVMLGVFGGIEVLAYDGVSSQTAGVMFEGRFPGASAQDTGKLVLFGFPFETIYPESKRFTIMSEINDFFFPTVQTPDPGLGIQNSELELRIYPNPTNGEVYFNQNIESIEIFNLQGQLVRKEMNIKAMDLQSVPNGMYLLKIQHNNSNITSKIQVTHE